MRKLVEPRALRPVARRADAAELVVIVIHRAGRLGAVALVAGLRGDPADVGEAERAVVEPVVAHPAVDHRALGRGDLERGMRLEQRHHHGEAFVRRAEHPDLAVRFGEVGLVDQPIDRVPGIGGVIDRGGIERTDGRARDDIVALRAIFAADILEHADIAVLDEQLVTLGKRREHVRAVHPLDPARGVVGGAGEQDRRIGRALGTMMTVWSLVPSRIGIITSRFS